MATLANRNNNPGNIKNPTTGQFRVFKSPQEGFSALLNDLQGKISGTSSTGLNGESTLIDFAKTYAPASDNNNPGQYTANLANKLGVRPDLKLRELQPKIGQFAEAIAQNEGYKGVISQQQTQPPAASPTAQPKQGIFSKLFEGIAEPVVTTLARPVQAAQSLITGQTPEYNIPNPFGGSFKVQDPMNEGTPTQALLKQVGRGAQTVALGLGGLGISGAVKTGALIGGGAGLEQDPTLGGAVKGGLVGGLTGGALGGAGAIFSKIAETLPARIAGGYLTKATPETIQYALKRGLGSPAKMLTESETSLQSLGKALGGIFSHPKYQGVTATMQDILPEILQKYPNAGIDAALLGDKLMGVASNQKTLIEKLVGGEGLTLEELQKLKSAVGENTYKTVLDSPAVKAGKDVANSFYQSAKKFLISKAPESEPLFNNYAKESALKKALEFATRQGQKSKTFTLRDLMALVAGWSAAGPLGAAGTYLGEKALTSPTVGLKTAGLLSKLGGSQVLKTGGSLVNLFTAQQLGQNIR